MDTNPQLENTLRPSSFSSVTGQAKTVQRLTIAMTAAKARGEACPHVLFHGPPGTGKTTMANLIAGVMGSNMYTTIGPAIEKTVDMIGLLSKIEMRDVIFIDEVHRLPATIEENLYPVMEDFRVDAVMDGNSISAKLPPFTLVGATTRAGMLSAPFRNRFGLVAKLDYYPPDDLAKILARSARILHVDITAEGLLDIAKRARGTPRIANGLLARVRDFANGRTVDSNMLANTFELEGIDPDGSDESDRAYIACLRDRFKGGPAGIMAIAATMNESRETLESVIEPWLLVQGKIGRTSRGRVLL